MVRYGIPLLDELRAIHMARRVLEPFKDISPKTQLLFQAMLIREREMKEDPDLHEAIREMFNVPCRFVEPAEFRHRQTGEQREMLTCANDRCEFNGKHIDPDRPAPETENCRISDEFLGTFIGR